MRQRGLEKNGLKETEEDGEEDTRRQTRRKKVTEENIRYGAIRAKINRNTF